MKNSFRKGFLCLIIGFFALFAFRLVYGSISISDRAQINALQDSIISGDFDFSRKNYASEKLKVERKTENQVFNVDQKYEKIASMHARSESFDEDEKKARSLTSKYNALIQFEQNSGLIGSRRLSLAIGVPPDKFDSMVEEIKSIGQLQSLRIDKTDKTNEYKDLNAQRISLEKARDSLAGLKGKGGRIEELINLENRILDVETQIQSTGVKLGEYDLENEFCTVKFGLEEKVAVSTQVPLINRIKVALEWTIKYYLLILVTLFIGSLFILAVVHLLEKLKWFPIVAAKYMQKQNE
jgi:hypothetical protein